MSDRSTTTLPLLGGRYRLVREFAHGGMATVYAAHDETLDRPVAVKVLHRHLASDPTFIDRFLREARAAAALSHPNVVAVHDWGESGGGDAYLVMEMVDGTSLRDVLRARGRLAPDEAAAVLVPAADGLAAAHARGLVHRDVKPENVLIAADGTVKVTDFGLARAIASTTQTFAPGSLVGSPHYLAPEAVRGEALEAQVDVYALGVLLYECLVGRPPFEGESPMATALRHTTDRVPPPSSAVAGVRDLDRVVWRATAPRPRDRYPDASAFRAALRHAVTPGSVPIVPRSGNGHRTVVLPSDALETVVPGKLPPAPPARARGGGAVARPVPRPPKRPAARRAPAAAPPVVPPKSAGPGTKPKRGRDRAVVLLAILLVLAAAGVSSWSLVIAPVVTVPDVRGQPGDLGVSALEDAGFDVVIADERAHSRDVPEGAVAEQEPVGEARRGATVTLVLSAGPRPVTVPQVAGLPRADAIATLRQAGLVVEVIGQYDEQLPRGIVLVTEPAGDTQAFEGDTVVVRVSRGREPIEVPGFAGRPIEQVSAQLTELGLEPRIDGAHSDTVAEGLVIAQQPEPGTVLHRGDVVELTVSRGPQTVAVPDVRGMHRDDAEQTLFEAGLITEVHEVNRGLAFFRRSGYVADENGQDPPPGTEVAVGSTVDIYVWK